MTNQTNPPGPLEIQLKTLTPIWTGDANGKADRLITTGLLGSIRWWFEVLVRGLEGYACDPNGKKCEGRNHCVVCELFGCTGWGRKFRFDVMDENGKLRERIEDGKKKYSPQILKDEKIILRFTPLRPIYEEEKALLETTLLLIAGYGAMGGKTVLKPTDEKGRQNKTHHQDYGLVNFVDPSQIEKIPIHILREYISQQKWRKDNHGDFSWASLKNFWCVEEKYLARQGSKESSYNKVLGRKQDKSEKEKQEERIIRWSDLFEDKNEQVSKWLAGQAGKKPVSKKIFSFKHPARTFGFVKPGLINLDDMEQRLKDVWGKNGWEFQQGKEIIQQLFTNEKGRS